MGILSKIRPEEQKPQEEKRELSTVEENQLLKASLSYMKNELNKFKEPPLLICEVRSKHNDKVIIRVPNGNQFLVHSAGTLQLEPGDIVVVEQKSLTVLNKLEKIKNFDVESFVCLSRPSASWSVIGGLEEQIQEIKEVVELPLRNPELFQKIGIDPPKGILLQGAPGTGKTMLAKAVANATDATFIEIVASELVQKFIGEGAKLVKDIFQLAKEKAPTIIFIDEIDALAAERVELGTSGEREVQRTFMQLLTEMDGFQSLDNVKVVAATNRIDILDPAILRPGRFDRIIEIPLPGKEGRKEIFRIHTSRMSMNKIDFEKLAEKTENFSGAEIKTVCTEAGYCAIRENRTKVKEQDFLDAITKVLQDSEDHSHIAMFG